MSTIRLVRLNNTASAYGVRGVKGRTALLRFDAFIAAPLKKKTLNHLAKQY